MLEIYRLPNQSNDVHQSFVPSGECIGPYVSEVV